MMLEEMDNLHGKHVSVIGAQRSGLDAARALHTAGAHPLLSDSKPLNALTPDTQAAIARLQTQGVAWVGQTGLETALPSDTALVVTSPGVPKTAPVLQAAVQRGLPVWSEVELAFRLATVPLLAITGTNGKTTTTLLAGAMLHESGVEARIAGNISADNVKRTLTDAAMNARTGVIVAEISSFQLEWVERFAPRVAVLTNITPDHLNRHASFEEYAATKARLFAAQTAGDWAILNGDDPVTRQWLREGRLCGMAQRTVIYASQPADTQGSIAYRQADGAFVLHSPDHDTPSRVLFHETDISLALPGQHSRQNALMAAVGAFRMGATPEGIARALRTFPGVPHRMEWVTDVADVRWINNSMCTNVQAGIHSLLALDRPAVVILGGADKELDFAPLVPVLHQKARHVVLIGSASDKLEAALHAGGYETLTRAASLSAAVHAAREHAVPGDAVILSPTCASFDMFADFEARGAAFRSLVHELQDTAGRSDNP